MAQSLPRSQESFEQDNVGPSSNALAPGPRKRRRVAVACKGCRTRKTRCNGNRPQCSTCDELGQDCEYQQPSQHLPARHDVSYRSEQPDNDLGRRLQALEEQLKSMKKAMPNNDWNEVPPEPVSTNDQFMFTPESGIDESVASGRYSSCEPGDEVDGMAAVRLVDDGNERGFFGASSNIAFMGAVTGQLAHLENSRSETGVSKSDRSCNLSDKNPISSTRQPQQRRNFSLPKNTSSPKDFELPPELEAERLINHYFRTVGQMIPCLDETSFRSTYCTLRKDGVSSVRRSWLALLNAVFAISSNALASISPVQELVETSETYYRKALSIMRPHLMSGSNYEDVLFYNLMGSYLQGTCYSAQAWTFHSLAAKTALELGLHSADASQDLSVFDREMRKRSWYWVIINDRIMGSNFGRPSTIPASLVDMDLPRYLETEYSSASDHLNLSELGIASFNAVISLSGIISETVQVLYSSNVSARINLETPEIITGVLTLTAKLDDWRKLLPKSVKIISSAEVSTNKHQLLEIQRSRLVLTLRYLGVRNLILRPVLLDLLRDERDPKSGEHHVNLLQALSIQCLKECIGNCKEVVMIVSSVLEIYKSGIELMGAWWFSAYYTFNSALIILGALIASLKPQFRNCFSLLAVNEMKTLLDKSISILHELDNGNAMLKRCWESLTRLRQRYSILSLSLPSLPADNLFPDDTSYDDFAIPQTEPQIRLADSVTADLVNRFPYDGITFNSGSDIGVPNDLDMDMWVGDTFF